MGLKKWAALGCAGLAVYAGTRQAPAAGAPAQAAYVNPLAGQQWELARTDQGVDYKPAVPEPVKAVGAGIVIYSSTADCPPYGWPGCAVIGYRLTAGPKAGAVVFVAEHLEGLLPAGTRLWPGRPIATALPGYPWTEWGWANCRGSGPAASYDGAPDGTPMPGGLAFARFMRETGAGSAQDPGAGPDVMKCAG